MFSKLSPLPRLALALLALALAPAVGACSTTGVVAGAGATTTVAASEERGLGGALKDSRIKTVINYYWFDASPEMYAGLSVSVHEGRALLTGFARNEAERDQAVRLAWKAGGVKEVINEILIDPQGASGTFARDTWITAKLRSRLLFDKEIVGINYTIDTVRGTVHLIGIAQNRKELEKVLNHARSMDYVERVVNHVILKNDPRRTANSGG